MKLLDLLGCEIIGFGKTLLDNPWLAEIKLTNTMIDGYGYRDVWNFNNPEFMPHGTNGMKKQLDNGKKKFFDDLCIVCQT